MIGRVTAIAVLRCSCTSARVRMPLRASTASTSRWISRKISPPLANDGRRSPPPPLVTTAVGLDITTSVVMDSHRGCEAAGGWGGLGPTDRLGPADQR